MISPCLFSMAVRLIVVCTPINLYFGTGMQIRIYCCLVDIKVLRTHESQESISLMYSSHS